MRKEDPRAAEAADPNFESKVNKTDILQVHVATPAYDGKVDSDYAQSMLMAGQVCTTNMIECSSSVMGNGAFIELARNVLVDRFLNDEATKDFTHFMFIDADLKFEPRAIAGLVRSGLPVSCGMYRRRQPVEDYPVMWTPQPGTGEDGKEGNLWMNGGWLRASRVPTGFLCIQRHVLEEMSRRAVAGEFPYNRDLPGLVELPTEGPTPWLFYTKFDENNKFTGEDFSWCDDYMALYNAGVFDEPIWIWPDFDFTHGGLECNYQHYLKREVERNSKMRKLGKGKGAGKRGNARVKGNAK